MSTNDRTESADIWNDVGNSQDERQNDQASGSGMAGNDRSAPDEGFADENDVLEAKATEVKRKPKFKTGLVVIALIGVSTLGFAVHLGYSLYSKLFPAEVTQTQDSAGLIDLAASLPIASTAAESAGTQQTLPTLPVGGGTSPTDVPAAPDDQMIPQDMAAAVASAAPADIKPVAASSVTPPVACPVAAPVPSCPSTVDKPRTTTVHKRTTPTSVSQRKTKSTSVAKATPPAQAAASPVEVESGPGTLTGFKVLAIEPKTGDFQQAWIRGSDGRLYIVREGDPIQGGRVTSVRFSDGSVKTTIGDVRK